MVLQEEVNQYWNIVDASLSAGYVESQHLNLCLNCYFSNHAKQNYYNNFIWKMKVSLEYIPYQIIL